MTPVRCDVTDNSDVTDSADLTATDLVSREVAGEQHHVDRVYAELEKAAARTRDVEADGLARGRTSRTGDVRDEELTGLFERDALVYAAAKRRASIDTQYEGLVFGRLDLGESDSTATEREVRHIGRLGVRDDNYDPLVIDWRAPAASPFYRATPTHPMGVVRRRVLRCRGATVVGVEDDLMVPEAPDDLTIVGDGALLAALTRSRGQHMRDIVATIQSHQDEAIRAPSRGVTEITGGPGTGKTVVALHRAAYLLYNERRRYESGGVLIVGPSAAYTAYIERVLPSLGEDNVTLRALGDLVDGVTATRLDHPDVAAIKGSLRIRGVLARAASEPPEGAPTHFRAFVGGHAVHLGEQVLRRVRHRVLSSRPHNVAADQAREALAQEAWKSVRQGDRDDFFDAWDVSREVDEFMQAWWRQLDPREVLISLADTDVAYAVSRGVLNHEEAAALAWSLRDALESGSWSVADVALIDDLSVRLGEVRTPTSEDWDDDIFESVITPSDARERLLHGHIHPPSSSAHVLVDEAQDLSPMQWRTLGRRGRNASWTVVGDAAQASWGDAAEAADARREAYRGQSVRTFHMGTNYRNAREIFDYARDVIVPLVPDADIPEAVRENGFQPVDRVIEGSWDSECARAVHELADAVDGSIAVVVPSRWRERVEHLDGALEGRVQVIDPLSAKGLEWDATVVIDPEAIIDESPGGVRVLYVALTRAAHRMTVLRAA